MTLSFGTVDIDDDYDSENIELCTESDTSTMRQPQFKYIIPEGFIYIFEIKISCSMRDFSKIVHPKRNSTSFGSHLQ